eukprot:Em0002g935a
MRVLVKVSVTLTVNTTPAQGVSHSKTRVWQEKCCEKKFSNSLKWPWLHYREENDSVSCYTCLKAKFDQPGFQTEDRGLDRRSRSARGNPDKLQDIAVIVEEEVEEQQQQETAENTTLNQASAAAWDPAIRNQRTPHKDDKHWHNDCRQGRFCILQDAYPTKQYGGRGRKRAVQKSWLEAYGWLEWSQEANALFCYPCCIFNSKRDNEWIKGGHSYFKKCTGAEGSLVKYANSLDHKAAEVCLCNIKLKKEMELLSALAGPVHASKVALEKMSTREYLKIMLQAVAFLAAGGLAFRGHDESSFSSNKGNFLRLLDLLASVSPDFAKQRERCPDNANEGGIGKGKNQMQRLKSLSETRWCCRIDAARCCKQHFGAVLKTAHEIKDSSDSTSDQKATALGVVCGVERFSFCFWLDVLIEILFLTDILNNALQKQRDTLWEAIGLVKATQKKVRELRIDAAFDCVKHSAIEFAAEYGIDVPDFTAPYTIEAQAGVPLSLTARCKANSFAKYSKASIDKLGRHYCDDFNDTERGMLSTEVELMITEITMPGEIKHGSMILHQY